MSQLRTFYSILITQAISQIGSQMTGLAIAIWLFQQTGDVTPLALVSFFSLIPNVLLANIAGLVADRLDRRWIMALADSGAAVGSLILMGLFFSGVFQVWHLYLITLFVEVCRAFQNPAFSASVALMVPDDQRDRANAVMQLTGPLAGLIAPGLAAIIYAAMGIIGVLAVDLLSFSVAITAMLLARIPAPPRSESKQTASILRDLLAGFAFLLEHKPMLVMVGFFTLVNFIGVGLGVLLTPYLLSRMGNDTGLMSIILTVSHLGAIVGGIVIGAWGGTRPRIHTVMIALILAGIVLIFAGIAQAPVPLGITLFLFMALPMAANIPLMSIMQSKVPPDKQGRVFAAIGQLTMLVTPLSPLLVGPLADNIFEPAAQAATWSFAPLVGSGAGAGMGLMFGLAGILIAVLAAVCYAFPSVRRMEATIPDWQADASDIEPLPTTDTLPVNA
ncbi:MAG TPA: MFS transporter [Aggregatilineales bacterium]|nr:MFS transporter [Aggregatilineales bacterium]